MINLWLSIKTFIDNDVFLQNKSGSSGIPPPPVPRDDHTKRHSDMLQKQNNHEPDYEVIEFGQYSNAPLLNNMAPGKCGVTARVKILSFALVAPQKRCQLCGSSATSVSVRCEHCQQNFCLSCDDMYHRHPKRQTHLRRVSRSAPQLVKQKIEL